MTHSSSQNPVVGTSPQLNVTEGINSVIPCAQARGPQLDHFYLRDDGAKPSLPDGVHEVPAARLPAHHQAGGCRPPAWSRGTAPPCGCTGPSPPASIVTSWASWYGFRVYPSFCFCQTTSRSGRFARPLPLALNSIKECPLKDPSHSGSPCKQWRSGGVISTENCLNMNVWASVVEPAS